jgi:hypothetical protein
MPIHCKRCHKQFSSDEELDSHTLVPQFEVCELRGETTEGITPDVEKLLRRRRRDPPNQSDKECWKAIYRLLFPKDEAVPDPCKSSYQSRINGQKTELHYPAPTLSPSDYWQDREDLKRLALSLISKQMLSRLNANLSCGTTAKI